MEVKNGIARGIAATIVDHAVLALTDYFQGQFPDELIDGAIRRTVLGIKIFRQNGMFPRTIIKIGTEATLR